MDPDLDRLEREFSLRVRRWISKQGIFFQLKHSAGIGAFVPMLRALIARILIISVIGAMIFWFYLAERPSSESFKEDLSQQIQVGTNAASIEIDHTERDNGGLLNAQLKINNLTLGGSDKSFYQDWYVDEEQRDSNGDVAIVSNRKQLEVQSAVIQPFGIGDGILNGWSGKKISLSGLRCHLKTGADTDDQALSSYQSIFTEYKDLTVDNIIIQEANISWGYNISKGSVKGATVEALKQEGVWKITVTGGFFSHGWLQNTQINKINMECHPDGLVRIVNADLRIGGGTLTFDAEIQIQSKPLVKGKYRFTGVKVTDLVGKEYESWLDGQIKGEGILEGALNSLSGVNAITTVTLDTSPTPQPEAQGIKAEQSLSPNDSFLIIRGKFPILKAMQRINAVNSYNVLRLNIGKFIVEQKGGNTIIKDIDIRADDFLNINGALNYAWMSFKERKASELNLDLELSNEIAEQEDKNSKEPGIVRDDLLETRLAKIFSGELRMGFTPQVFSDHPEILNVYAEDPNAPRVWIPVEMNGTIHEVSSVTAERLVKIVQDDRKSKEN